MYNLHSKTSIIEYAKQLKNKTLREVFGTEIQGHGYKGKGNFGQLIEKYYFKYAPNSDAAPDFAVANLELKSSPLKRLKNRSFRSKERLVLNIINYEKVVFERFESSSFWKKNSHLLLIFYLHEAENNLLDYRIKLVDDWSYPPEDLAVIRHDWTIINNKIKAGKAHELSEGDTFYLGACTKGGKGGNLRRQPYHRTLAKQRAYSLKQGYVNHIIAHMGEEERGVYGKIIKQPQLLDIELSLEEVVMSKFEPFYDKRVSQIIGSLGIHINPKAKSFYANLTKAVLGIGLNQQIEEFQKAEIIVKTVRLKTNNLPKEDISFPNFKYKEIVKTTWEDSDLKQRLERKFFFVFFQYDEQGELTLKKVRFWNMPYQDVQEVETVWSETVTRIRNGQAEHLPKKSEHHIMHIRPHARNKADTYETPQGQQVVKKCFWLNSQYIRDEIFLKKPLPPVGAQMAFDF